MYTLDWCPYFLQQSTDKQPNIPTGAASTTTSTGATGAAKEPIYSDLGRSTRGDTKPPQSAATQRYVDINTIVPGQRVTQSYHCDDVVVDAGTAGTGIGGGPAVPPPVPAKGGESKSLPVPKKTEEITPHVIGGKQTRLFHSSYGE